MNNILHSKSGFSLAEVLVALAVLSIFIFPVSGMFMTSMQANESALVTKDAYAIANKAIESMIANEDYLPCENLEFSNAEYAQSGINQSVYEVRKTVLLNDHVPMQSGLPPIDLTEGKKLLTIDASVAGQISFPNSAIPTISYLSSSEQTIQEIYFDDTLSIGDEVHINDPSIYYINVIGGQGSLKLVLYNGYPSDKVLYLSKMPKENAITIEAVTQTMGEWLIYNNLKNTRQIESGSVATAEITILVNHLKTKKSYSITTKRVYYKYE